MEVWVQWTTFQEQWWTMELSCVGRRTWLDLRVILVSSILFLFFLQLLSLSVQSIILILHQSTSTVTHHHHHHHHHQTVHLFWSWGGLVKKTSSWTSHQSLETGVLMILMQVRSTRWVSWPRTLLESVQDTILHSSPSIRQSLLRAEFILTPPTSSTTPSLSSLLFSELSLVLELLLFVSPLPSSSLSHARSTDQLRGITRSIMTNHLKRSVNSLLLI